MAPESEHIFSGHLLGRQNALALPPPPSEPEWIPFYLIVCLALLVLIRSSAFQRALRIVKSTFSNQVLQQLEREETNMFRPYALALHLFFMLNVAFLIYKVNERGGFVLQESQSFQQFLFFFAAIFALMALKLLANQLLGFVLGTRKTINEYTISSALVNQTFGLALFPCLVVLQFTFLFPLLFLWLSAIVLAASVLLRWYRGLAMCIGEQGIGILQIFSYFCALEILPVLVLVKYVIETF